jgi:hypothetical protein
MQKLIYLAKRKPGFTFDEFVCRWRKHGAFAMGSPIWRHAIGYVQAEPIRPAPIPGASEEFDAVACYMIRDAMFKEMTEEDAAAGQAIAQDELETFAAPIPTVSLWVKEERIRAGELGGITAYLFFQSDATARDIADRARDIAGLNRITLNMRNDDLGPESNTLPYRAVVELSASSVPTLAAAVGTTKRGLLPAADLAVVTRDAVLWDRLPQVAATQRS